MHLESSKWHSYTKWLKTDKVSELSRIIPYPDRLCSKWRMLRS